MTKNNHGFTLIELLVVISLIGILSTLVMANLNSARERSRDVQRKSDLRNIQTALRLYYNDKGDFPTSTTFPAWGSQWVSGTTVYMNVVPKDPLSPNQEYIYTSSGPEAYTLEACLENKSDDKGSTTGSWCPSLWEYIARP